MMEHDLFRLHREANESLDRLVSARLDLPTLPQNYNAAWALDLAITERRSAVLTLQTALEISQAFSAGEKRFVSR